MKQYEHKYLRIVSYVLTVISALLSLWFLYLTVAGIFHIGGREFRQIHVVALLFFGYVLYASVTSIARGLPDRVEELYQMKREKQKNKK